MAKLILSMDGLVLKEIALTKERTTIGRKPHNDVQIDNLAVSGEHAVIVSVLNESFLEDLGSTNGTIVNGSPIKKHFLQSNDIIELGKYRLKFIGDPPGAAAGEKADFERTMVLRPSAMKAATEHASAIATGGHAAVVAQRPAEATTPVGIRTVEPAAAPAAAPAPAAPGPVVSAPAMRPGGHPLGTIQLLSGANAGKELELTKPLTTLGKPGVQVAVLTRRPQGYFITHVEGTTRPEVNGQQIGPAPHALKDHDVIELAGVKMEFFLKV
jgi:pSer/pThr/pTyr-binding forkhead associated (FHA) protein